MRKVAGMVVVMWSLCAAVMAQSSIQDVDRGTVEFAGDGESPWVAWGKVIANWNAVSPAAKGDLLGGTAADTVDFLSVGTNGHVLTVDSTQSLGFKWATPGTLTETNTLTTVTTGIVDDRLVVGSAGNVAEYKAITDGVLNYNSTTNAFTVGVDSADMLDDDHGDVEWLSGVASVEAILASAAPTLSATDNIAIDTNGVSAAQGELVLHDGTGTVYVVGTTDQPADDEIPKFDSVTGTISWEADITGGTSGDNVTVEGVSVDTTADFNDDASYDIAFTLHDGGAGGPDGVRGTVNPDAVALTTDTTGNYVTSITNGTGILGGDGGSEGAALTISVADNYLFNTGDVGTGVYDFGGATSFEIVNGTGPTVNASGEIAIDTNGVSASQGEIVFYDGTGVRYSVATTDQPLTNEIPKFNGTTVTWVADEEGSGDPDQNIYDEITGDVGGPATVASASDILDISGGVGGHITTTVANGGAGGPDSVAIAVDDDFLLNTGDTGTGSYDFGGATDFEIVNSATPTVNTAGEVAIDTNGVSASQGEIVFHDGAGVRYAVATTDQPSTNEIPKFNGTTITWVADEEGSGDPDQNLWDDITSDGATSTLADGISDSLEIAGGTGITTTASNAAGAAKVSIAWDGTTLTGDVTGSGTTSIATTLTIDTKAEFDSHLTDGTFAFHGGIHHDAFADFVTNEHLDWTQDKGATNIHRNNLEAFTTLLQGVVPGSGGGTTNFLRADGNWAAPPDTDNTASNLGAGIGVYETKSGIDLRFNSLVSQSPGLTIAEDDPNNEIDFTLNEFSSVNAGIVSGSGGGTANFLRADGNWAAPADAGETNTASNLGAGIGVYEQKSALDLQFNSLVSQSAGLTISEDDLNNEVDFTLNLFSSINAGIVSGSGGGTTNFLRADGSWAAPPDTDTDTQLTDEQVEDYAGAMWTGNTETRATVTYQDLDGTIDIVVDDMTQNLFLNVDPSDGITATADIAADTLKLDGGTGISVTGTDPDTITITNTAPNVVQDAYTKIAGTTGPGASAQQFDDTLTFSAGAGISIVVADSSPDYVFISNTQPNVNQNLFETIHPSSDYDVTAATTTSTLNISGTAPINVSGDGASTITISYDGEANNLESITTGILDDEIAVGIVDAVGPGDAKYTLLPNGVVQYSTTSNLFSAAAITGLSDVNGKTGTDQTVVFRLEPVITRPTILDLTNVQHAHTGTTSGGALGIFKTVSVPGVPAVATAPTDTLTIVGGTDIDVTGSNPDTITIDYTGSGGGDPDQNLFESVTGDTGTATADAVTDSISVVGGTNPTGYGDFIITTASSTPDKLTLSFDVENNPDRDGNPLVWNNSTNHMRWGGNLKTAGSIHSEGASAAVYINAVSSSPSSGTDEGVLYALGIGGTDQIWAQADLGGSLLDPHDANGRWIHHSYSGRRDEELYVEMQTLIRFLAELYAKEKGIPLEDVYKLTRMAPDKTPVSPPPAQNPPVEVVGPARARPAINNAQPAINDGR